MSVINLNNYEAFLLDYSEGKLNTEEVALLITFAALHPELAIRLEDLTLPVLPQEPAIFDRKDLLKKDESPGTDEELLSYLEGDLPAERAAEFEKRLPEDAGLAKDLELYRKTILKRDDEFLFEYKSTLLKTEDDLIISSRLIAYMEEQLNAAERADLERSLKETKALQAELALVLKTRSEADLSVVYPDKPALRKEAKLVRLFVPVYLRVAAALLFLAGFVIFAGLLYVARERNQVAVREQDAARSSAEQHHAEHFKKNNAVPEKRRRIAQPLISGKSPRSEQQTVITTHTFAMQEVTSGEPQKNVDPAQPVTAGETEIPTSAVTGNEPNDTLSPNTLTDVGSTLVRHSAALVEEEEELPAEETKQGFWKKAAGLARRVNQMGVRSVDGEEKGKNSYSLSFGFLNVEKR